MVAKSVSTVSLLVIMSIQAATAADGEALFKEKGCISCHGAEGAEPTASNYPKLKGQNQEYLVQQIKDIKSGARDNGQTVLMKPIVQGLSDAEIEALADYLSSL